MIEIQCTSCQTRYRIDERILPEDTPTFKCSRCGHVFSAEPRKKLARRAANAEGARGAPAEVTPATSADAPAQSASLPGGAVRGASAPQTAPPMEEPAKPVRQAPPAADASAVPAEPGAPPTSRPAGAAGQQAAVRPARPERATDFARTDAPQAQPEELATHRQGTEELVARRFREEPVNEQAKAGDNLAFDFSDESRTLAGPGDSTAESYAEEKWEVGDAEVPSAPAHPRRRIQISDTEADRDEDSRRIQELRDRKLGRDTRQEFERIRSEEVSAEARRLEAELRGKPYRLHSAGSFVALFALVIFGFGILTMLICGAPMASAELLSVLPVVGAGLEPPISPARRVALSQVEARYATLKGNQSALVISGTAENLSSATLGTVQLEAALLGPGHQTLRSQAVYCGNNLSSKMLGEMTPHEIDFFEKLDAPRSFTLAPQASAPFVIVFIAPPAGAAQFQLRVVDAGPAAAPLEPGSVGG